MRSSIKIWATNAVVAMLLLMLYIAFVFDVAYFYTLDPNERTFSPYLSYALPFAIFALLCGFFSGARMFLAGAAAVVVLAVTSACIHFHFGEIFGVADFSGISGAWHLTLLTGALFLCVFLVTAVLATGVKYALKKIFN